VGDIDDAGDAENQRQTRAHEEQAGRRGKPVERLEKEGFETHGEEAAWPNGLINSCNDGPPAGKRPISD